MPDEVVNATGEGVGFLFGEWRAREGGVEIVQNEHFHVGLRLGVFGPVWHGPQMGYERGQEIAAGQFKALAVGFADGVFEEHLEEGVFILAEALFGGPPLLGIESFGEVHQSGEGLLDGDTVLLPVVVGDDLLIL